MSYVSTSASWPRHELRTSTSGPAPIRAEGIGSLEGSGRCQRCVQTKSVLRTTDYEYSTGGTQRNGQTIEAWVWLRCVHCHKTYKIIGYCKQAGCVANSPGPHRERARECVSRLLASYIGSMDSAWHGRVTRVSVACDNEQEV